MRLEDFGRAAQLKREMAQLEAADVVAQVQSELAAALAEERYEDAARLRDAGMAALQVRIASFSLLCWRLVTTRPVVDQFDTGSPHAPC